MKFLVVLALAFAVASAGFSGSLVQQTRPILQQAIAQLKADLAVQVPARNSAEVGFQTAFVEALANQANNVINQIQDAVDTAQEIAQNVVSSVNAAVTQAQNLAASAIEGGQQIVQSLVNNLFSALFGNNGRSLSPALIVVINQFATNPSVINAIHNSAAWQCMRDNGVYVDFNYIKNLYYSGQINPSLLDDPVISHCVAQSGGLEALISGSSVVQMGAAMAQQLGLTSIIDNLIIDIMGEELGGMIIGAIHAGNGRGFFGDLVGSIGNAASNVWNGVTNVASNAWNGLTSQVVSSAQYIAQLATATFNSAAEKFEIIKQLAVAFIQGGIHTATTLTQQAAQQLIDTLSVYASDLGILYDQVVDQLTQVWDGLTIPTWNKINA